MMGLKAIGAALAAVSSMATPAALVEAERKNNDLSGGRFHHRGGPGTKAIQRAAQKARNVKRHRKNARG